MKGYPFDLKRAQAGDALCNGLGSAVEFIGMTNSVSHGQKVVGAEGGEVWTYYEDGGFSFDKSPSALDLRMVTDGGPTLQQETVEAIKPFIAFADEWSKRKGLDPEVIYALESVYGRFELNKMMFDSLRAVLAKVDANVGS